MEYEEIREYCEQNNETGLTTEELNHVARCCQHIYRWYYEGFPLGGFLTAVVRNNLTEACFQADGINSRALKLYAYFLTCNLPADWSKKANGM